MQVINIIDEDICRNIAIFAKSDEKWTCRNIEKYAHNWVFGGEMALTENLQKSRKKWVLGFIFELIN